MEDIKNKAYDDELNKADSDSIESTPKEKITVPKIKQQKDNEDQD